MTGRTVVDDASVVKHRGRERAGDMANTAVLSGGDVSWVFSNRVDPVVTSGAVGGDACMVKYPRCKACNPMTQATIRRCRDMGG